MTLQYCYLFEMCSQKKQLIPGGMVGKTVAGEKLKATQYTLAYKNCENAERKKSKDSQNQIPNMK